MFGVEAHIRIGMFNTGERNLDRESLQETLPGPTAPLTPPPKLAQPYAQHVFPKRSDSLLVARYGMVLEIPPHHRLYPLQGHSVSCGRDRAGLPFGLRYPAL